MSKNPIPPSSPLGQLHRPWDQNDNLIWLGSTLRLLRNVEKFKFPHKLEEERKKHILDLASKAFKSSSSLDKPYILKAEEISPAEKEFLIEHFLIFEGFQEANRAAGFGLDESGEVIALFNIKEHMQLQTTDTIGDLEKSWERLTTIENELSKSVNFAFSPKFGFLTADSQRCGTGLVISAFLHVPAIIHSHMLTDLIEREKMEGVITSGLQGNPDELVGDILMLRNVYTLGINEEAIISNMRNAILHVVVSEKDQRNHIKQEQADDFKDHILRSVGLLKFSHQLEAQEALQAISFVKLGLELGWLKGMSIREINTLFFDSRRSHLAYALNKQGSMEDIAKKRAEFLRQKTAGITIEV